jgi:hypothetical protein
MKAERCPTCGRKHKRSTQANALYWVLLHTAAERLRPGGKQYSAESYHTLMKSKYLGCDDIPLPNGKTVSVPRSTANLDAGEFGDYFAKVEAELAQHGVFLDALEQA